MVRLAHHERVLLPQSTLDADDLNTIAQIHCRFPIDQELQAILGHEYAGGQQRPTRQGAEQKSRGKLAG